MDQERIHRAFAHLDAMRGSPSIAAVWGRELQEIARVLSDLAQAWAAGDRGRSCRVCECTDDAACYDDETCGPCYWVGEDLCSACVGTAAAKASEGAEGPGAPMDRG